jgi:hypothetical protein
MNSKVIVTADATTNAVITVSENNSDYGYIRVQQVRTMIDDNGFLKRKVVSALIPGAIDELKEANFFAGQQLDGKIVIEESLEPFNTKTPERDLKIAGETGIVCTLNGQPIYRRTRMSFDATASDVAIKHDNVEELRAAYANASKANTSALQNAAGQDFNL